jgi:hypothetical protein
VERPRALRALELPPAERRQLLVEGTIRRLAFSTAVVCTGSSEEQVDRTPEATALDRRHHARFKPSWRKGLQLARAHHLRSKGVGRE